MSLVLSALEFDVLWESFELPRRHVALDVPSDGTTSTRPAVSRPSFSPTEAW